MTNPNYFLAFSAGLLSFFSPCVLPLIPSYLIYLTGLTLQEMGDKENREQIFVQAVMFVLGFSVVFVLLGAAATFLGQLLLPYKEVVRLIGGSFVIYLGFFVMGVFRWQALDLERRLRFRAKPAGYFGSFLVGLTFAAAWTPCVGPILAGILTLAGTEATVYQGIVMLILYSLGLALPFLLVALFLRYALVFLQKLNHYLWLVNLISGWLLVLVGLMIIRGGF